MRNSLSKLPSIGSWEIIGQKELEKSQNSHWDLEVRKDERNPWELRWRTSRRKNDKYSTSSLPQHGVGLIIWAYMDILKLNENYLYDFLCSISSSQLDPLTWLFKFKVAFPWPRWAQSHLEFPELFLDFPRIVSGQECRKWDLVIGTHRQVMLKH